ncbi:Hypothetical Protein FCC1311_107982 [Hondaea fermentalgiana]|uniref:Uncharacterized protein n=1 Tax=Hondaea fermentalgiana TaxID=2315210 RepID=A0A2R5GUM9_9STRA|nr:Hypothetical Protein FCC1311_107982 [Hondaea fermentalgiana]|eukprot:GBG34577.1 Hypothetical Protein FCC1311_107982 [Hondaea fermentalgiana]
MPRRVAGDDAGQGGRGGGGKRKKVNSMDLLQQQHQQQQQQQQQQQHQQQQHMAMNMMNFVPLFSPNASPTDVARVLGLSPHEVPIATHASHDYEPVAIFTQKVRTRIAEILAPAHQQEIMMHDYPTAAGIPKKVSKKKRNQAPAQPVAQQQHYPDPHMNYASAAMQRPMDMAMHQHHHQPHAHHMGGETDVSGVGAGDDSKKPRAKFPHEYGELLRNEITKNPQTKPKELQSWLKAVLVEKNGGRLPADFPDDKKIATKIANLKTSLRKRTEAAAR